MADTTRNPYPKPWRIPFNEAARLLSISRSTLKVLLKRDPDFPRPVKDGTDRRAGAYFITEELEAWLNSKIKERDQQAA